MHSSTCILNIDYLFFRFQKILMIQVRLMIQVMMTQWFESHKAGPSRKRSRADENNDGGISQQMERLQLQDMLIKIRYKFIFLTDSISLLHNLPKILLPNIQYLFANTSKSEPWMWTNLCLVFTKFSNDANMQLRHRVIVNHDVEGRL